MKRHILSLLAAVALPFALAAQTSSIGGMSREKFDRVNAEGNAKVAAIQPNSTPLSAADMKLLTQIAQGGMMQLQVSQAALPKTQGEDARTLAQSEVEEQTGISQKLTEIATAKGASMPGQPAPGTDAILQQIGAKSGAELDRYYVQTSGVDGHKKLESTMTTVSKAAKDPALKALAVAALPVIRTHMKVSKAVVSGAGRKTSAAAGAR